MKAIIIFLLVIIVAIMGYNFYHSWHRFHPPSYRYEIPESVTSSTAEKELKLDYLEAVEKLNGYVITQWSANDIDVRNPEDDDDQTNAAVTEYGKLLAQVKYFEGILLEPKQPKLETSAKPSEAEERKNLIRKMFYVNPLQNEFRLGQKSALIFEVQRILIEKGDSIRHDGLYRAETQTALKDFEAKNNLFPDGKLDAITLEALLE